MITYIICPPPSRFFFFFFNDTATTEIYTLSLHDALPISEQMVRILGRLESDPHRNALHDLDVVAGCVLGRQQAELRPGRAAHSGADRFRSEEHTSELQSLTNLVCRLLLEKKKDSNREYRD